MLTINERQQLMKLRMDYIRMVQTKEFDVIPTNGCPFENFTDPLKWMNTIQLNDIEKQIKELEEKEKAK